MQVVPPATAFVSTVGHRQACAYPAYRETLPGGPSYTVLDQVDDGRPTIFRRPCRPAMSS